MHLSNILFVLLLSISVHWQPHSFSTSETSETQESVSRNLVRTVLLMLMFGSNGLVRAVHRNQAQGESQADWIYKALCSLQVCVFVLQNCWRIRDLPSTLTNPLPQRTCW